MILRQQQIFLGRLWSVSETIMLADWIVRRVEKSGIRGYSCDIETRDII